jgi:hypothetical protein
MSVNDSSLGREKKKKNHVRRRRQFRAERKKKTLFVDDNSLGQKKKKKNPVRRRRQFRAKKKRKKKTENKEVLSVEVPKPRFSRPGFQDLGFRTSTHIRTDRLCDFISSID